MNSIPISPVPKCTSYIQWQKPWVNSTFVNWVAVRCSDHLRIHSWIQVDINVPHAPFWVRNICGNRDDMLLPADFQTVTATFWSSVVRMINTSILNLSLLFTQHTLSFLSFLATDLQLVLDCNAVASIWRKYVIWVITVRCEASAYLNRVLH